MDIKSCPGTVLEIFPDLSFGDPKIDAHFSSFAGREWDQADAKWF